MAAIVGKNTMVTFGLNNRRIIGLGTWRISGMSTDLIEVSEFCVDWKNWVCGLKDGGEVSFNGYLDRTCTSQFALMDLNMNCTCVTSLRFHLSCVSTAGGYFYPMSITPFTNSCIRITSWEVTSDKAGLVEISFTGKICGLMDYHT